MKFCDINTPVESCLMLGEVLDPVVAEAFCFILELYIGMGYFCTSVAFEKNALDDFLLDCCKEIRF